MADKGKKQRKEVRNPEYDLLPYNFALPYIGEGAFEKPDKESTLPRFFDWIPDPYDALDAIKERIDKKSEGRKLKAHKLVQEIRDFKKRFMNEYGESFQPSFLSIEQMVISETEIKRLLSELHNLQSGEIGKNLGKK